MLEARLNDWIIFQKVLEGMKDLTEVVTFNCSKTGIDVYIRGEIHLDLELPSDGFKMYRCDSTMSFSLKLSLIIKSMNCILPNECLLIKASDDQHPDMITFGCENEYLQSYFFLKKIRNPEDKYMDVPLLTFDCVFKLSSGDFIEPILTCARMGELVKIYCSTDKIKFYSNGTEGEIITVTLTTTDLIDFSLREPVALTFDSRHLLMLPKIVELSDAVTLSVKNDTVLKVEVSMLKTTGTFGKATCYLQSKMSKADISEDSSEA